LAVGCDDQRIYLWDVPSKQQQAVLNGHCNRGIAVQAAAGSDYLASRAWDGTTRLWDPVEGRQLVSAQGHLVALRRDGGQMAVSHEGKLELWDVADGRECRVLHHGRIGSHTPRPPDWGPHSVDFSADGRLLASASVDGVRVWDASGGGEVAYLPLGYCEAALFAPGGPPRLVTVSMTSLLSWPIATDAKHTAPRLTLGPPQRLALEWQPSLQRSASWSGDGRWLAMTDPPKARAVLIDPDVRHTIFVDPKLRNKEVSLGPHPQIEWVTMSPDRKWAATAGWNSPINVWEAASGRQAWQLPSAEGRPRLTFSPDSRWLVTSTREKGVSFCRAETGEPGFAIAAAGPGPVAFSRDGMMLAAVDLARGIRLLDPATGKELVTLAAPRDNPSTSLSFSPDGSQLAAATNDHTIHLWDLRALRRQLRDLDLDWDSPAYLPQLRAAAEPLSVRVAPGEHQDNYFVSLGLREAEAIAILDKRYCAPRPQPMSYYTTPGRRWSKDWQLFCPSTQNGAYVELQVGVPATAEYILDLYFTQAADYGKVQVSLDGKPVGPPFDGYYPEVIPSGKVSFGKVDLRQGDHRLRLTVVGKNDKAAGFHFGLDCLELAPALSNYFRGRRMGIGALLQGGPNGPMP
jgi:WD40 repeat protein